MIKLHQTPAYFANHTNVNQRSLRGLFLFDGTVSLLFLHFRLFLGRLGLRLYFLLTAGHNHTLSKSQGWEKINK